MGHLLSGIDQRLPYHELVLGVLAGGRARCYPLALFTESAPVLNDTLGGEEIVVLARAGSWMASAYSRRLDDRVLNFSEQAGRIVDAETGSSWEISGRASAGALAGRQLRYVHSGIEEFVFWAAANPGTEIHGHATAAPAAKKRAWSSYTTVPPPVINACKKGWFARGARVLVSGCGDGLVAATLAELGMNVVGIDPAPAQIERARRSFGAPPGLRFEVGDPTAHGVLAGPFDAVVDVGFLQGLERDQRRGYVENLAAATRPGARVLLVLAAPPAAVKQRAQQLQRLFAPHFKLRQTRPLMLSGEVPAFAARLVRS
jgi:SAM-dependent methyltransferase